MRVLFRIGFMGLMLLCLVGFIAWKMESCAKPEAKPVSQMQADPELVAEVRVAGSTVVSPTDTGKKADNADSKP